MNIFEKALYYLAVPKCVGCGERLSIEDKVFCPKCRKLHIAHKIRNCAFCGNVLSKCACTNDYLKSHYVKKLAKVFRYIIRDDRDIISNKLIYSLKRDNRRDVVAFLADELSEAIRASIKIDNTYIVTAVPRRKESITKYGYDHARLLAIAIAKRIGLEYVDLLRSTAEEAQKKMVGGDRIKNATFDYRRKTSSIIGKRVIIIDDIVTTGASMGACAALIKGLGAKEIFGASVAIAYKDKPVFPS